VQPDLPSSPAKPPPRRRLLAAIIGAPPGPAAILLAFLSAAFVWNYGLGLTYVMVPLYAHSQGLSGAEIGILFSLPVLGQMAVNLVGGAYTDRVGGRRIMLLSAGLMALAGLGFIAARGFWMLVGGQLLMVLSRATFWPAAWSSASELPGHRGAQLGRLNATTNLGQILGTGSAGFLLGWLGYAASFLALAAIGLSAAAIVLAVRAAAGRRHAARHAFVHFRPLLRLPVIYFAVLCAYLSALPFSLSTSFYPLLLLHYGFSADASGLLIALRAVGSIGASLLLARLVRTGPASRWPSYAGAAVALAIGALPLFPAAPLIAALMLLVGVGSGTLTLYFQITISETSSAEQRGSALALGGFGWGLSHLTTPLIMGFLADRHGIASGFYVLGALALSAAGTATALRRWAFSGTRLAAA